MSLSVQEIVDRLNYLIECAKPYMFRTDVNYVVCDCTASLQEMLILYNTDGYNPEELMKIKDICNSNYLRLEYSLAFLEEQHNSYAKRIEVYKYYTRLSELVRVDMDMNDKLEVLEMFDKMSKLRVLSAECGFDWKSVDLSNIRVSIEDKELKYENRQ